MRLQTISTGIAATLTSVFGAAAAFAQDLPIIGQPGQAGTGFQPAVAPEPSRPSADAVAP